MVRLLLCTLLSVAAALPVLAQEYPVRKVKIVVPLPPGGGLDLTARLLADRFEKELGQPFLVENKIGASGLLGAIEVSGAEPDGYTLLAANTAFVLRSLADDLSGKAPSYDTKKGFTPIGMAFKTSFVLVINPTMTNTEGRPILTFEDFIRYAHNAKINFAISAGEWTATAAVTEAILRLKHISAAKVQYRSLGQQAQAVIAGKDIHASVMPIAAVLPQIESGSIRALGVFAHERSDQLRDVPTFGELGLKIDVPDQWGALFGPPGLNPAIVQKLNAVLRRALADPEVQRLLHTQGCSAWESTPEEVARVVVETSDKWHLFLTTYR